MIRGCIEYWTEAQQRRNKRHLYHLVLSRPCWLVAMIVIACENHKDSILQCYHKVNARDLVLLSHGVHG